MVYRESVTLVFFFQVSHDPERAGAWWQEPREVTKSFISAVDGILVPNFELQLCVQSARVSGPSLRMAREEQRSACTRVHAQLVCLLVSWRRVMIVSALIQLSVDAITLILAAGIHTSTRLSLSRLPGLSTQMTLC